MHKFIRILVKSVVALLLFSVAALAAGVGWLVWHYDYEIELPDHRQLANVAATGQVCASGGQHMVIPFAAIPSIVRNALLAAEDPDFYRRPPFNPFMEFARAALFNRRPSSPPLISNMVVRCLVSPVSSCKGIDWHICNLVLMHRVERDLHKDLIFDLYLNGIALGRGTFGVGAAANAYFGKSLTDLSLAEAAYIAGLPRSPNSYGQNLERGTMRRNVVLDRMVEMGTISPAQAATAKLQPLVLRDVAGPI
jgi:membrane peptidoglycan carboxypeptidase